MGGNTKLSEEEQGAYVFISLLPDLHVDDFRCLHGIRDFIFLSHIE